MQQPTKVKMDELSENSGYLQVLDSSHFKYDKSFEIWDTKELSIRIQELDKEVFDCLQKVQKNKEKSRKLDSEILQVKIMQQKASCIFNNENRIIKGSRDSLKKIHEAYQALSRHSVAQNLQTGISERVEELLQEKEKLLSVLGRAKLERSEDQSKLEEIMVQISIKKKRKKAVLVRLQKNVESSEAAKEQALEKLMQLKNNNTDV